MPPPSVDTLPDGAPTHWPELDLYRTLAATLMVLNHVAVDKAGVWDHEPGPISTVAFVGGFAPVVFFFLTGLGFGVQSVGRRAPRGHGYALKVLILLAADAMLWVSPRTCVGLDFFGFIGLSMLLLEWVRRMPRSGVLAAGMAIAVVAARFLLGPMVSNWAGGREGVLLKFVLGRSPVLGFPYPLGPWLAYPLLGYVMGRLAAWGRNPLAVRRPAVPALLAAFAGLTASASWVMAARGESLMRFGTMTSAYFAASLAALAASLVLVIGAGRLRALGPVAKWVALSGVRSFAVVPLHYALMMLCNQTLGPVEGLGTFARNASVVLTLSFAGSALVPRIAAALNTPKRKTLAWAVVPAAFVCAYLLLAYGILGVGPAQLARTVIQVALCVLLAMTRPSRRHHAASATEVLTARINAVAV